MRRIGSSAAIVASLVAVVMASTAQGASPARLWFAGYGSWNTYSMPEYRPTTIDGLEFLSTALKLGRKEIRSGVGLGFEVGVDLPLTIGLGYERLFAANERVSHITTEVGDDSIRTELKFPANAFYGLVEYRLPISGPVGARLGMAGGLVTLAPVARIAVSEAAAGADAISLILTGTGPLFRIYATGEFRAGPDVVLFASAGYRFARVSQPSDQGVAISDFPIDYSGFVTRVGFDFAVVK